MRFSVLASAVAISCCGFVSFSSAQTSQRSSAPTPAPTLHLVQSEDTAIQQLGESNEARTTETTKPSPFDFFPAEGVTPVPSTESASLQSDVTIDESEPTTKAVGRRHHSSSPADAIISGAQATGYFAPIDWSSAARQTPNPTADYMLREWCVDGLWNNHAAEMALQCARQSQRIYGGHHHCGQCRVQSGCHNGACHQSHVAAPVRSSGCAHCASTTPRQPTGTQFAQQYAGPNGRPMPISMLPPPAAIAPAQAPAIETGKVASYPTNVRR